MPTRRREDSVGLAYADLVRKARTDLKRAEVTAQLRVVITAALDFLSESCAQRPLTSNVSGKQYFAFHTIANDSKLSRPVNASLFDAALARRHLGNLGTPAFSRLKEITRQRVLYSAAVAFCCANDLLRTGDKKTPGSFFEYFVGHLVARALRVNPTSRIEVLSLERKASLPTDLIFDLGADKSKLHLPVKLSTRERVIQVWAHQRVLDGVYGVNRFKGVLVCLTETNFNSAAESVVEVCLPDQWTIYQMFIAQLTRVYYLDLPGAYKDLGIKYPFIKVKPFAAFFEEKDALISSAAAE